MTTYGAGRQQTNTWRAACVSLLVQCDSRFCGGIILWTIRTKRRQRGRWLKNRDGICGGGS